MVRTEFIRLEAVMLNGIELFADNARVLFAKISNPLKVGAVYLCPLSQGLVHQRLHAVAVQSILIFDLVVAILLHAFDLA